MIRSNTIIVVEYYPANLCLFYLVFLLHLKNMTMTLLVNFIFGVVYLPTAVILAYCYKTSDATRAIFYSSELVKLVFE